MILYDTKFLQLKSVKSQSGHDWFYAHRPNTTGAVVILPIINQEKILFLIEKRPPLYAENIAELSVGLPAGLIGDEREGESTEDAIKAELLEEAGLKADEIIIKSEKIASSPGCTSEMLTIAIAKIGDYNIISKPISDGGIIFSRELVNINNVHKWLNEKERLGYAITSSTLAALFYLNEEVKFW